MDRESFYFQSEHNSNRAQPSHFTWLTKVLFFSKQGASNSSIISDSLLLISWSVSSFLLPAGMKTYFLLQKSPYIQLSHKLAVLPSGAAAVEVKDENGNLESSKDLASWPKSFANTAIIKANSNINKILISKGVLRTF